VFWLHDNCQIEKDVQIGPNVVIGQNVVIDREATLSNAIILDHTYVGRLLNIDSKIVYKNLVIDIQTGEHIAIKDQFLLAETEDMHVDLGLRRFVSSMTAMVILLAALPLFALISLYLRLLGGRAFSRKECLHTDFRWFIPIEERSYNKFHLYQFQLFRKDGSYVPLGRLLERMSLHRLPELINVMRGDLAFVGVKPLSDETCKQIQEDWQKTRFNVPAGITGLWYLRTDEGSSLDQILIEDSYYAVTRSVKSDLQILFQTPRAWFQKIKSPVDPSLGIANGH
jgi:lipopolysaccharide/colanic/teichoic acid biosynthesis glycosyltransferase